VSEIDRHPRRQLFDLLAGRLDAVAIELVARSDGDGEDVDAEVELAFEQARVGVVQNPQDAAEEGIQLALLAAGVEVEVVQPDERQRVVEGVVVERAADQEKPVLSKPSWMVRTPVVSSLTR
jgi:hypothetical protein